VSLVISNYSIFIKALITKVCPLDSKGYQPRCITIPETKTSIPSIPESVTQELYKSQSNSIWLWVGLIISFLIAMVFVTLLLRARAKSKLLEIEIVRVKAESRQYRMNVTELKKENYNLNQTTQKISTIETQSEVILFHSFKAKVFKTSKSGESLETCADMTYVNLKDQVFAIADGVSQAFNSAKWAELLVTNASKSNSPSSLLNQVRHLSSDWEVDCTVLLKEEEPQSFIRQKQMQGSQSTLAILKLVPISDAVQNWQFSTIGDSLLVVLDASKPSPLIKRFYPWSNTSDFPAGPDVIATNPPYLRGHVKTFQFESVVEESCLLMTDALARYAVSNGAVGSKISMVFPFLEADQPDFESWVKNARQNGLGDDDSTLISIFPSHE